MKHQCDMEEKLEGNLNFYCCFWKTKRNYILNSEQNMFKSLYQESHYLLKHGKVVAPSLPSPFNPDFLPKSLQLLPLSWLSYSFKIIIKQEGNPNAAQATKKSYSQCGEGAKAVNTHSQYFFFYAWTSIFFQYSLKWCMIYIL